MLVFLLIVLSFNPLQSEPIHVTAARLASDFIDNYDAARAKYWNRDLIVRGTVLYAASDHVDLETKRSALVRCFAANKLPRWPRGVKVVLRGRFHEKEADVFLEGCRVE